MCLICWIAALFLNSLGGQRILDEVNDSKHYEDVFLMTFVTLFQSISIGTALYENTEWYDYDIRIQRDLLFVLMKAQQPLVVKTGPFGYMSQAVFIMVRRLVSLLQQNVRYS